MKIESLRQRIGLLVLLPVGVLLVLVGVSGVVFMRDTLFREWEDASIVKLQRAAQQVDLRLGRINEWIEMFSRTSDSRGGPLIQQWILEQIKGFEGVTDVRLIWVKPAGSLPPKSMPGPDEEGGLEERNMMRFYRGRIAEVTLPAANGETGRKTVSAISHLMDHSGALVGNLVVSLDFHYLVQGFNSQAWRQGEQACLIAEDGRYLAGSENVMKGGKRFGEKDDPFELALLEEMKQKVSGTFLGPGRPPRQVGVFYDLSMAPWTMVLFASSEKVLAPLGAYRNIYFVCAVLLILFIFYLNRIFVEKMVSALTALSSALGQVAGGRYGKPLPVRGNDEIARLIRNFNHMVEDMKNADRHSDGK